MRIQFIGAAHEVTGSCTLLTVGDYQYLTAEWSKALTFLKT